MLKSDGNLLISAAWLRGWSALGEGKSYGNTYSLGVDKRQRDNTLSN